MKVGGTAYRSVWVDPDDGWSVHIFDQTKLPWALDILRLTTRDQVAHAIKSMQVRGAPLIGAVAAYGLCLALREDASTEAMERHAGKGHVNVLAHCNAGWLATVDWGTALAPIYVAHDAGIDVHVWVDETRPRLQGAALTAFELGKHGVPHTVIADNAGGHLMQHGQVDLCIVGADRVTRQGDAANKIGTYLK